MPPRPSWAAVRLSHRGIEHRRQKLAVCRDFKPSDGLEPWTPSLPWNYSGKRWQPTATIFGFSAVFAHARFATDCHRLQPRGSIKAPSSVVGTGYIALLEELRLGPPSLLTKNTTLPVGNSALVKRERDRLVQLELAATGDRRIEGRGCGLANPRSVIAVTAGSACSPWPRPRRARSSRAWRRRSGDGGGRCACSAPTALRSGRP
jgi:hypothetical protein